MRLINFRLIESEGRTMKESNKKVRKSNLRKGRNLYGTLFKS